MKTSKTGGVILLVMAVIFIVMIAFLFSVTATMEQLSLSCFMGDEASCASYRTLYALFGAP